MRARLPKIKHYNPKSELNRAVMIDPRLSSVLDTCGYPAARRRDADFATLAQIINAQQLSTRSAAAIWDRLASSCRGEVTCRKVLNRGQDGLLSCGLSRQKSQYLLSLADEIKRGGLILEDLAYMADSELIGRLMQLKGIGQWSAEIFAMFALGRRDVFPSGDLALQVAVQNYAGFHSRPMAKEVAQFAQRWSPHRSSVALLMWKYYGATTLDSGSG